MFKIESMLHFSHLAFILYNLKSIKVEKTGQKSFFVPFALSVSRIISEVMQLFFYFDEKADKKPKDVALIIGAPPEKISEWANDLERYSVMKFTKTPYGSFLFKESEIKVLREYGYTKLALGSPRDAIEVIKESSFIPKEKEDLTWAKDLKFAIWRRH